MKKSIKSFIVMIILVLGVFQLSTMVFAKTDIPSATSDFYVNDFANVFSNDEKTRLMDNAVALSDEHDGIQVVITTVKSLDGDTIEDYAFQMYNKYNIGKNDMGLLILLSTEDRQIRVEVGKTMEAYINDSKAGRFIDNYAIPSLKENKFAEGLINLQESLIDEIVTEVEAENTTNVQTSNSKSNIDFLSIFTTLLFVCIVIILIIFTITLIRKIIKKSREKQQKIDTLTKQLTMNIEDSNEKINTLQQKNNDLLEAKNRLTFNYQKLEDMYKTLEDRYKRVQTLYPTADKEVTEMIEEEIRQRDISLANKVDLVIEKVINLPASKDIVSDLDNARTCYSKLNQKQQSYVKSDINRLEQLYNESLHLKQEYDRIMEEERKKKLATAAVASITSIISCISIGKATDFKKLKKAKSIYDNLESGALSYFDKSVANKLDKLYREAKRDKEEKEQRERRRREEEHRRHMQNSSHSISSSSSHYGGFGGHSGGGGASRGF